MSSDTAEDLPMTSLDNVTGDNSPKSKSLSTRMILGVAVIISIGLAIGLGVGLGVGLQSQTTEFVYVTGPDTDKTTAKSPTFESTTGAIEINTTPTTTTTTTDEPTTSESNNGPWTSYRLRDTMRPSHYSIQLTPDFDDDLYRGYIDITFNTSEETDYVIFHAHSTLRIRDEFLRIRRNDTMDEVSIVRKFRWPENDYYVVQTADNLLPDEDYIMSMQFANTFTDGTVGIYKSSYIDPNTGVTKFIMASTFAPTEARRGYPCFDEPAMKAKFTTTIQHDYNLTALSNMPIESTRDLGNGRNETIFQTSVPMSTYLSCFVVGELKYVEEFSSRNIPLRIYAAPHLIDGGQASLALESTVAMFDQYEELFNMTYSLPKYDQVSLPQFEYGAMENWGLVTYLETNLMWHPEESTTDLKQRVVSVIAHEMVHQWFGNSVTMEWWNNVWLSEGFASYFEYRGVKWANEDWRTQAHHLVDDIHAAMRADQSTASHPINVELNTSAQPTTIYDTVAYQKGSSVLNMMQYILGEDLFIGGLRNYLKTRQFSVATEQDLWADIQEYVTSEGVAYDVKTLMDPWVQQMGYPVVSVKTMGDQVIAMQDPAFTDQNVNMTSLPESDYEYRWNINLNYFTQNASDTIVQQWFNISDPGFTFTLTDYGDWIKFNEREQIFHRVNYDRDMWGDIVTQLSTNLTVFSEMDRSHLVDDAFNLAPAKRINYTQALDLTRYLDKEESYFVWQAYTTGTSYIRAMLLNTEDYTNFKTYYVTRVKPVADTLGWDASMGIHEEKRLRPTVLDLAARYGDVDALNNATNLYQDWRADKHIQPDVRSVVYMYGIQEGSQDDWRYMLEKYRNSTNDGATDSFLSGLASTNDLELIAELLNLTKDPEVIREQDFFTCLTYIASNTLIGNTMTWSWVRVNWDYMVDRFGLDNAGLAKLVPSIVKDYNTKLQKWEVETFFQANPAGGASESDRESTLRRIDLNIAWMADNAEPIGLWLESAVSGL